MSDLEMEVTERTVLKMVIIIAIFITLFTLIVLSHDLYSRTLDIQEAQIRKQTTEITQDEKTVRTKERHNTLQRLPFLKEE